MLALARSALAIGDWREALRLASLLPAGGRAGREAGAIRGVARETALARGEGLSLAIEAALPIVPSSAEPDLALVLRNLSEEPARIRFAAPVSALGRALGSAPGEEAFFRLDVNRSSFSGAETSVEDSWVAAVPLGAAAAGGEERVIGPFETLRVRFRPGLDRGGRFLFQHCRLAGALHPAGVEWGGDPVPILFLPAEGSEVRFYPDGIERIAADPLATLRKALGVRGAGGHAFVAATLLGAWETAEGLAALESAEPHASAADAPFVRGALRYLRGGAGDADPADRIRRALTRPASGTRLEGADGAKGTEAADGGETGGDGAGGG